MHVVRILFTAMSVVSSCLSTTAPSVEDNDEIWSRTDEVTKDSEGFRVGSDSKIPKSCNVVVASSTWKAESKAAI